MNSGTGADATPSQPQCDQGKQSSFPQLSSQAQSEMLRLSNQLAFLNQAFTPSSLTVNQGPSGTPVSIQEFVAAVRNSANAQRGTLSTATIGTANAVNSVLPLANFAKNISGNVQAQLPPQYLFQVLENRNGTPAANAAYMMQHGQYSSLYPQYFQSAQFPQSIGLGINAGNPTSFPFTAVLHHQTAKRSDESSVKSGDSDDKPKKRRKKDPKAPKNPVSAYLFYVAEQRVKNTGKNDGKSFAEVAKDLGKRWKNLLDDEKQVIFGI